jgi:cell division protein FtsI/penicillin-binding protein 2
MTSIPGYDPAYYSQSDPKIYKNPIISDGYEPGSTFKTLIMTAGLDAGVVTPETVCTSCNGPTVIADKVVRNWDNKYFPSSTMKDVILHSDNVGMVFVAKKLGKQKMYQYLKSFGLGELTNIDLQEEASPTLRPAADWYDIDQATIAFGQGIAVTPLQMTTAVNTIANRGVKVEPHIITEIITEKGKKTSIKPSTSFQVVSTQAAIKMTEMMTYAVNNGAVKTYKPDGYLIAGKTGTAQVAIEGHYDKDKVIASFVGFAPADNPKFTMLVTLASPKSSPWGSTTAAPLWFSIATELFRYYRIPKL